MTNAEIAQSLFISEKTAIHHVSAILQKLGASTRGEAAATARKMGIPTIPT
jgi:DNA-binding NarL/FixJ family response regulator